jgi:hypothetical protein
LRLGTADGDPNQEFGRIRGVVRLSDGRIVVADGAAQEIRYFGPAGGFLMKAGGSGGGPGEFGVLWSIARTSGDSILAWDWRNRRLTIFAPDGRLAREIHVGSSLPGGTLDLLGRFQDGSILITRTIAADPTKSGIQRSTLEFLRLAPTGAGVETLARVPGREFEVTLGPPPRWSTLEIPYGRASYGAITQDRFFVGRNDRFEIQERALDGRVVRTIRHPPGERAISRAEVAELEAAVLAHGNPTPRRRENIERLFRDVPRPAIRPAFGALLTDPDGNLWVAEWVSEFAPPSQTPKRWFVFGRDGSLRAQVSMPPRLRPREIGRDYVLGTTVDDLDVESVELNRLRR